MAEPGEEEEEEEEVDQEEVMPSPTRDKFARLPRYTRAEAMEVYGQSLDGPLQPDPSVLRGTLPNGASFLVRTNREPQARAELRVVIKIGSVVEEEGERGLAHLIEHLAFRGSQGDDQSFLLIKEVRLSIGWSSGTRHATSEMSPYIPPGVSNHSLRITASPSGLIRTHVGGGTYHIRRLAATPKPELPLPTVTGFDETIYEIAHVPTDDPDLLHKCFHLLQKLSLQVNSPACPPDQLAAL